MKWTDIFNIAMALEEQYPDVDILKVNYTDLAHWIQSLPGFDDRPERCNEKVLEAIQMVWLDERD